MRRLTAQKLVIATHNAGKLREFQELLGPYVREIVSSAFLGLPEPEETGATFAENALIKARAAAKASGFIALADDSGLCVNALGGQPGLHSARWSGPNKDYALAMRRLHNELNKVDPMNHPPLAGGSKLRSNFGEGSNSPDKSAHFTCVLALAWPDGHTEIIEGRCEGTIIWPPRGTKGLGYDPVFVPEGHMRTFAEMESEEKHALSHRGKALRKLVETYFEKK